MSLNRRTFLRGSAVIAGGVAIGDTHPGRRGSESHALQDQQVSATSALPFLLATAGSSLAARVDAIETTLLVTSVSGERLWIHDNDFQIDCGGEVIEVTSISGSISPQTFTVVRSINQVVSSHSPGTAIQLTNVETL